MRAQLLQNIGQADQATRELLEIVRDNPELDSVWFMLSEIYELEQDFAESIKAAQTALLLLQRRGGSADDISVVQERIAKLIAMITHPLVVRRILRHLELPSEPPPIAPARPPPQMAFAF